MTITHLNRLVLAAVLTAVNGCSSPTPPPELDFSGTIASVQQLVHHLELRLRGVTAANGQDAGDKIVHVSSGTQIVGRDGLARYGHPDLTVGARISVRTKGVELRSLPPRYAATLILLLHGL